MSTLAENAAAVKQAQLAIDAAIVAKGGTTAGGLSNAAAAIESIPSGTSYPVPWKNDGKTHIWLNVLKPNSRLIYEGNSFVNDAGEDVVIDWGDGTIQQFPVGPVDKKVTINTEHVYATAGDFEIVISNYNSMTYKAGAFRRYDVGNYTYITPDYADSLNSVMQMEFAKVTGSTNSSNTNRLLRLVAVKFDDDCTFDTAGQWFLGDCQSLRTVVLPSTVKTLGNYAFYHDISLNDIQPNGFEKLNNSSLIECMLLANIDVSSSTSVGDSVIDTMGIEHAVLNIVGVPNTCVRQCYNVRTIEIGEMCTSVGQYSCTVVPRLESLTCRAVVPPTAGSGFMQSFPTTAKIYVPYSADHSILASYQAATNWSHRASQMFELNPDGTIPTEV